MNEDKLSQEIVDVFNRSGKYKPLDIFQQRIQLRLFIEDVSVKFGAYCIANGNYLKYDKSLFNYFIKNIYGKEKQF